MAKAIGFYGILILTNILFLENSEAVICYQCVDSKSYDCQFNFGDLRKSALAYLETNGTIGGEHYWPNLKNCTSKWGNYCVEEHYKNQGQLRHRCADSALLDHDPGGTCRLDHDPGGTGFVKKEPFILGKTLSYIRGCSSGSADTSIPEVRNFSLKNKDRCRYYPHSKDHILACVTWCDSNFCNGPLDFDKFPKLMVTTSACSRPLLHTFIIFLLSFFIISERYTFKMCS
ncbi:uncharacterized protein LOC125664812 [Ostrea edulis]|uniref:uncharacterized protein LOC125664812 n=1 Tax=Ostrea edulis TaxID=37623 RepID=UPI0024AF6311|nr:uncharacterized protein LOC125664812 [Ostrea edulis]